MRATIVGLRPARHAAGYVAPALVCGLLWGSSLSAAVTETVSIQNRYGVAVGPQAAATPQPGGSKETFYLGSQLPAAQSETGVNYTATADSSGFFFLHDNYCVGSCNTYSQTIITFTLHNDGDATAFLRFDSQITPGHIARILGESAMSGSFDFTVTQSAPPVTFGEAAATSGPISLYSARGGVNSDGIFVTTSDERDFNGLTRTNDPDGRWQVADWSTTNLNLDLAGIGPGQTAQVTYTATYNTIASAECTNIFNCQGLQVVFGDPRNSGAVTLRDAALAANLDDNAVYPVIGRDYTAHMISAQFVDAGSPLPDTPPMLPPTHYGPLFDPRVVGVPEPGTWALMIGGFALAGSALRRRRARPAYC